MGDEPDQIPGGAALRLLRWLVVTLTLVMIAGLITLIVLFVIRFPVPAAPDLPSEIRLPAGDQAVAITFGQSWYAVVTEADEILIFERGTGRLRQRIAIATDDP